MGKPKLFFGNYIGIKMWIVEYAGYRIPFGKYWASALHACLDKKCNVQFYSGYKI